MNGLFAPLRSAAIAALLLFGVALEGMGQANASERDMTTELERQLKELRTQPATSARLGEEARLLFYLREHSSDGKARDRYRDEGKRLASKALEKNPDEPSALLWWTALRGSEASALNPFKAVKIAREVERTLQRLKQVAPDYDHAAADRVLGRLYQVAPAVVSVGDMKRAGRHLAQAMSRFPEFPGNQLFYADWLKASGNCAEARALAQKVLRSSVVEQFPLDAQGWKKHASKLVEETEECE